MAERSQGQPPRHRGPRRRSVTTPAERHRRADPARTVAYAVMRAVDAGAYTNLELPKQLRAAGLRGRDAAFATELVYGATRLRGRYDPIIALAAGRPLDRLDPAVLDLLRLGTHQLLGMRVPVHAACDTTVALARDSHGPGVGGLVNAVLHRVSERTREDWLREVAPEGAEPLARLAVATSHPEWIVRALRSALLGHGAAGPDDVDNALAELLAADNEAPVVTLAARPGLATVTELTGAGAVAGSLVPTAARLVTGGDPGALAAVREGRAAVQDEGSQLIALVLAAAPVLPPAHDVPEESATPAPAENWLDLCAGPGGKAGLLAAIARDRGATLFANDSSEHRARLVRQTVAAAVAAGAQVFVGTGDGREIGAAEPGAYDRVLVDAPCSGLGALRRRPEARWRRSPDDVPTLVALQGELLDSALRAVRPGGVVLYATCSPHLPETRYVLADALRRAARAGLAVEELDTAAVVDQVALASVTGVGAPPFVQLWPHRHGTDAMFAALLRRTS